MITFREKNSNKHQKVVAYNSKRIYTSNNKIYNTTWNNIDTIYIESGMKTVYARFMNIAKGLGIKIEVVARSGNDKNIL